MPTSIQIDPATPLGSESLTKGPLRFHEIKNAILQILGFTGVASETFGAPFTFSNPATPTDGFLDVVGPPTTDFGIATKSYVDVRGGLNIILSGGPAIYASTLDPSFALITGAFYIIGNSGVTNNGPVTATVGIHTPSIVHANLAPLVAGDFVAGADYGAVYDSGNNALVLLDFIGGTIPLLTTFSAGQTTALATAATPNWGSIAPTKQYVDTAEGNPTYVPLTVSTALPQNTITNVLTASVPAPTDDNNYLLMVSYGLWVDEDVNSNIIQVVSWVEANGNAFGLGGAHLVTQGTGVVNASGLCQTIFSKSSAPAGITVLLRVLPAGGNMHAFVSSPTFVGAPQSFLTWSLIRTS